MNAADAVTADIPESHARTVEDRNVNAEQEKRITAAPAENTPLAVELPAAYDEVVEISDGVTIITVWT
jgi:hypothetical protein